MKNIAIILIGAAVLVVGFLILSNTNKPEQSQPQTPSQSTKEKGGILAGQTSPFLEFNQADYDKALSGGKIIFLDFYANWCPICRAEEPILLSGFDELETEEFIGFRVNYNDSDTDANEKALAKHFGISYQHTKVILKNGQQFSKSLEPWDKEKFDQEMSKALEK